MRYYLKQLHYQPYWELDKLCKKVKHKKLILADDGLYQLYGDNLYRYKVRTEEIGTTTNNGEENYIENYTLLPSGFELVKVDKTYCIPYDHVIVNNKVEEYKTHPKSGTKLVIEKVANNIELFFESSYTLGDNSLKEDIVSLLSHLK